MCPSSFSKVRAGAVVVLVSVAVLVAGCGGSNGDGTSASSGAVKPKPGGTLRISQGEEAQNLDPLEGLDPASGNVISEINEALFKVSGEGETEPWLAESVKATDGERVWTLQLRKGATFSTGKAMTSADVLFTLEQARKSAAWETALSGIEKVAAPSPSTIVITNKQPAPELEAVLSQWSFGIVPANYGGVSEKEFNQHPIGTGPFMLDQWKHGESLTLVKNPHYWRENEPYLDKVVVQTVTDAESRVAQLKGGQLDIIPSPPWSQVEAIENTPGLAPVNGPLGTVYFMILNGRLPLFANTKVRESINLAVDREGMVDAVLSGHGEPAGTYVPPAIPFHDPSLKAPEQNVAKAKQLLAEAVEEGVKPNFTFLVLGEDTFWNNAAQIVQQNLEEVGFNVTLDPRDQASVGEDIAANKFEASTSFTYSIIPSPAQLFSTYNTYEGWFSGADTTETTRLAEEASSAVNVKEREAPWFEAQQILAKEKYVVPVTYAPFSWVQQEDVVGFEVSATGVPWLGGTGFSK